jgi:hypothetical protein
MGPNGTLRSSHRYQVAIWRIREFSIEGRDPVLIALREALRRPRQIKRKECGEPAGGTLQGRPLTELADRRWPPQGALQSTFC